MKRDVRMQKINENYFEGERSLFNARDLIIEQATFGEGESPLKESQNIELVDTVFKWKYPLWYAKHVKGERIILETMARSGIWYTNDIELNDSTLQAPKLFRVCNQVKLNNIHFSDAQETLWKCNQVTMKNVQANGDYFGMNSTNLYIDHLDLVGNYCFDGAKNVEVHNSRLVSKDAFWNCENVTIYDSIISGEYLAWNTKNLTLINCTIESEQGLCYVDDLKMINCRVLRTNLAFEYCRNIDAEITTDVMSIKNPISGNIRVASVGEIIMDDPTIDPQNTVITQTTTRLPKGA